MLDLKYIRENAEALRQALSHRNNVAVDVDALIELDQRARALQHETDRLRAEQNAASKQIGQFMKEKQPQKAEEAKAAMKALSDTIEQRGNELKELRAELDALLMTIPNVPHESVPVGTDESANRVERVWGTPRKFDFVPKDHIELGESLGILDFERAAKLSGARFSLSMGAGAHLERALINFMLDIHTGEHGYTEVLPPFAVNSRALEGTGQLPKFAEDQFRLEGHDLWMIPTAEVPLTNIHQEEILGVDELPKYYAAYSPCFRSEAGSYGKDTRGLIRQHQFNKVELVKICSAEKSFEELEKLTQNAETILQRLELPYRVVSLCTGDIGFSAAKTYDLEVWLPGQDRYREISSCSNCTDFQARRANIRYRAEKKPEFAHTLNGSGIAVGRAFIAILENYQNADGSISVPKALQPYLRGRSSITRASARA